MGRQRKVKRTAPGATTANTLTVAQSVTIILDEPLEADDGFELHGPGKPKAFDAKA